MKTNKKNFYLKKIDQRGHIEVWLVDGKKVRRDVNEEFTNFGQHFHFPFIPENEFWLDNEATSNEQNFFIDHLLVERKLMKNGVPYLEALEKANKKEAVERARAGDLKIIKTNSDEIILNKIHKQFLEIADKKIFIWLVDARLVRSVFDLNFTEGGHDFVYNYIPSSEVWLDDDIFPNERPFVLLHELFERQLMAEQTLVYSEAHKLASQLEWKARHNKKNLEEVLFNLGLNIEQLETICLLS